MKIEKKQEELDTIKWYKSVALGFDACGSFDYCSKCNKDMKNPCASAYAAANVVVEEVAPAKPKRTCTRKTVSVETAVKVEEKKTCKKTATKTTAKKATATKKTTTKKASK